MYIKITKTLLILSSCLYVYADNLQDTSPNKNNGSSGANTYIFSNDSVYDAIRIFANQNNLKLEMVNDIASKLKSRKISAKFSNYGYADLVNQLSVIYGFDWFTYNGTMYITDKKYITQEFSIYSTNMKSLKDYVKAENLLLDKFNYSEFPSSNKVVISGPKAYLDVIRKIIDTLQLSGTTQQFGIYKLKYASATDIYLSYNNTMVNSVLSTPQEQQMVVPGVATLLQNLQGQNIGLNNVQSVEMIKNGNGTSTNNENSQPNSSQTDVKSTSISNASNIQADQRLNAIVIRDTPENLRMYKSIIERLDVPTPLVSVELLIIEINDSKINQEGISWWAGGVGFNTKGLANANSSNGLVAAYGNIVNGNNSVVNNTSSFLASLKFLEENGFAKTVGNPTLTTIDNIPATATVGINTFTNPSVSSQAPNAAYQSITGMSILPHVISKQDNNFDTHSNQVKLTVSLLDGDLPQFGISYPTMFQGSINSQAVLKDRQSLLIASYNKKRDEVYEDKVPVLGDIPLLGWFFKNKVNATYTATTLYLLTPKVIWIDMHNDQSLIGTSSNSHAISIEKLKEQQNFESFIETIINK
ncbi:MAG: secretin N-terminal domain-containing protein [Burkholderiales bacterium]|nr:secretin N-terminal domain-containing protein [Burkholderiales bacterium]